MIESSLHLEKALSMENVVKKEKNQSKKVQALYWMQT